MKSYHRKLRVLRIVGAFGFLKQGRWLGSADRPNVVGGTQLQSYLLTLQLSKLGISQDIFTRVSRQGFAIKNTGFYACGEAGELFFPWFAYKNAKGKKYDLIHVHLGISPFIGITALLLKKTLKIPLVCTVNLSWDKIIGFNLLYSIFGKTIEYFVLNQADEVVTLYKKSRKSSQIPDAVQQLFFETRLTSKRGSYLLFVGRATHQKGLDYLMKAFARSLLNEEGIRLVMITDIRKQLNFSIPEGVRIIQNPPRKKIAEIMSKSIAILVPSRFEERGTVIGEAFATGTRVLASNLTNLRNAYASAPRGSISYFHLDVDELAIELKKLVKSPPLTRVKREQMRSYAYQYYEANVATMYFELYKTVDKKGRIA